MISLSGDELTFESLTQREWLETNGIGGFSSSTLSGMNTRRYHGLLTAATKPPLGRLVLLSKFEEVVLIAGRRYELSTNQYPGVVHPQGFQFLKSATLEPYPKFIYDVEGRRLEKSLLMIQGENTIVASYELQSDNGDSGSSVFLELRPLVAFRDYHSTTHENRALSGEVDAESAFASIKPYSDLPALHFAHNAGTLAANGFWYRNFQYAIEQERGLDAAEDLYSPFLLTFELNRSAQVIVSTEKHGIAEVAELRAREIARRRDVSSQHEPDSVLQLLRTAADQFIVSRGAQHSVIAGYHWFGDWGRDTMIALPGLTLATGESEIAKSILAEFARHLDQGMLPNRFPDAGETPEYNTVDATLWFFEAVRSLLQYTGDYEFVQQNLYEPLKEIVAWHQRGTRYNIHVDADGLLVCGEPGVQLTWMDAKVGDWVVTPRHGKPVEIQALWYNALRVLEQLAKRFGEKINAKEYGAMADAARRAFNDQFWYDAGNYLYDVVNNEFKDVSLRPNQVIAVSLEHSPISRQRAKSVLKAVERDLLTPRGLRTLAPNDPQFRGRYEGGPQERDGAYHQGTVWPWLMGPYLQAYSKTFGSNAGRRFAQEWLSQFRPHLEEACVGQISEIFDGAVPHQPRGCVAQAWSVAELLRAMVELVVRPEPKPQTRAAGTA